MKRIPRWLLLFVLALPAQWTGAVTTQFNQFETYPDFAGGELDQLQLTRDGKLRISRELKQIIEAAELEMIWDAIRLSKTKWIIAGGHEGRILLSDMQTTTTQIAKIKAPEVTSLFRLSENSFLAASAPEGTIYKFELGADDKATSSIFFKTGEQFVWDMQPDGKGGIYAATGQKGKVYQIDREGKGKAISDFTVANVIALLPGKKNDLYIATQGPGRIYHTDAAGKLAAFYESPANEVRKIALDDAGALYAAVNSDLLPTRPYMQQGFVLKPPVAASPAQLPPPPPRESKGNSVIVKIEADGFVRELWQAPDAPIHDLIYDEPSKKLLVSAGQRGHVYQVDRDGEHSLLLSIRENEVFKLLRIAQTDVTLLIANTPCVIYQMYDRMAEKGEYRSPVIDGEKTVGWGRLQYDDPLQPGLKFSTRAGNVAEPDSSWTGWSGLTDTQNGGGKIESPAARFLQWKAELSNLAGSNRALDRVEIFHIEPNQPPYVAEITIAKIEEKKADAKKPAPVPPVGKPKPPTPAQQAMAPDAAKLSVDNFSHAPKFKISWKASDPNEDALLAKVSIKGEGEERWLELEDEIDKNEYELDGELFGAGQYRIKIAVSDSPANPEASALAGEWISDPFAIDGEPPRIDKFDTSPAVNNGKTEIKVALQATDQTSLIAAAQYLLDDGDWKVLFPVDGIFDSTSEQFEFAVAGIEAGQHVLQVLCTDREGNTAVAKKVVSAP